MTDTPDDSPAETQAAFATLTSIAAPTNYTAMDRYRDFRRVFMSSPEGQRVLWQILSWAHLLKPPVMGRPIDPYLTHVMAGESNLGLRLLKTINEEPPVERPGQTARKGDA